MDTHLTSVSSLDVTFILNGGGMQEPHCPGIEALQSSISRPAPDTQNFVPSRILKMDPDPTLSSCPEMYASAGNHGVPVCSGESLSSNIGTFADNASLLPYYGDLNYDDPDSFEFLNAYENIKNSTAAATAFNQIPVTPNPGISGNMDLEESSLTLHASTPPAEVPVQTQRGKRKSVPSAKKQENKKPKKYQSNDTSDKSVKNAKAAFINRQKQKQKMRELEETVKDRDKKIQMLERICNALRQENLELTQAKAKMVNQLCTIKNIATDVLP